MKYLITEHCKFALALSSAQGINWVVNSATCQPATRLASVELRFNEPQSGSNEMVKCPDYQMHKYKQDSLMANEVSEWFASGLGESQLVAVKCPSFRSMMTVINAWSVCGLLCSLNSLSKSHETHSGSFKLCAKQFLPSSSSSSGSPEYCGWISSAK